MNDRKRTIVDNEVARSPNRKKQVQHAATPEHVASAASLQTPVQTPASSNKSFSASNRKSTPSSAMKGASRGKWTKEEDERLLEIIHKDQSFDPSKDVGQVGNWTKIASDLNNGRKAKQCRDRWLNYLRPGIKKGDWTTEEEDLIRELHETFGARWSAMAKMFPNRTDNDIKNKWYSMLRAQERMEIKVAQHNNTPNNAKQGTQKKLTPSSTTSSKRPAQYAKQTTASTPPSSPPRACRPSPSSMPVKKRPPRPTPKKETLNVEAV